MSVEPGPDASPRTMLTGVSAELSELAEILRSVETAWPGHGAASSDALRAVQGLDLAIQIAGDLERFVGRIAPLISDLPPPRGWSAGDVLRLERSRAALLGSPGSSATRPIAQIEIFDQGGPAAGNP